MNKTILAVETSQSACSVALLHANKTYYVCETASRMHSQKLLPAIETVLGEAAISLAQIDAIAFSAGPGSFTGLRVGAATVQGFAFALQIPLIPVSSLLLMALQAVKKYPQIEQGIVCVDARVNGVYWSQFTRSVDQSSPRLSTSDDQLSAAPFSQLLTTIKQHTLAVFGDAVAVLQGVDSIELYSKIVDEGIRPDAKTLLEYVSQQTSPHSCAAEDFSLNYLGGTSAWKKVSEQ